MSKKHEHDESGSDLMPPARSTTATRWYVGPALTPTGPQGPDGKPTMRERNLPLKNPRMIVSAGDENGAHNEFNRINGQVEAREKLDIRPATESDERSVSGGSGG